MNPKFQEFIENYKNKPIAIAVSGGVDSICLLHWLVLSGIKPVVLHVNHRLRDIAEQEEEYVKQTANKLGLISHIMHWDDVKPETGLESAARTVRYNMMIDYCKLNNIEIIMTAHQADDQIETFLMNLGRGSGVYGLSAIRYESVRDGIKLVRPLLSVFRSELISYCDENNIKYFSDEMNDDEKYTRVKIRKNRHFLSDKMGISDDRILLAIENLSRTRDAIDVYIESKIANFKDLMRVKFNESFLFDEPDEIKLRLISRIIQLVGKNNYTPRLNSLKMALNSLNNDCKITLGHCTLRRLGDNILIVPQGTSTSFRDKK